MTEAKDKSGGIQVIARATAILRLLGDHPGGLSLSRIAGQVGLARSTVQRIVQALETEGFVELSGPGGGFQLGPSLSELVYRRQTDIVTEVRPALEDLCATLGETVALCRMAGASVVTIDRCIADQPLRVVFPLGTIPFAAHQLAPGRAMLAELPTDRLHRLLAGNLPKAEVPELIGALAQGRDAGRDTGSFIPDLSGFAVPLRTHMGLYAIAAVLPTSRVGDHETKIFAALRSARDGIEARIGLGTEPAD